VSLQKFRSHEEAEQALICPRPDSAYFEKLAGLYELWDSLIPRTYPRGVFKYRTIEEANEESQRWLIQNALQTRKQRKCA
jgi:hypothetical protein